MKNMNIKQKETTDKQYTIMIINVSSKLYLNQNYAI